MFKLIFLELEEPVGSTIVIMKFLNCEDIREFSTLEQKLSTDVLFVFDAASSNWNSGSNVSIYNKILLFFIDEAFLTSYSTWSFIYNCLIWDSLPWVKKSLRIEIPRRMFKRGKRMNSKQSRENSTLSIFLMLCPYCSQRLRPHCVVDTK